MRSTQLSPSAAPKTTPPSTTAAEMAGISRCTSSTAPPSPEITACPSQEINLGFPSPKYPKPQSALVFGALLFGRQEHGESRARRDQALHALPSPAPERRQLCPRLPACLVLPAQPLPRREEATGRRGGMANHGQGRTGNTGSSSSHPRPRARSITERELLKTSGRGTVAEPIQVLSIHSPNASLHRHLPGKDQQVPGVKQRRRKGGTETFQAAGSESQQQNRDKSSEMASF